MRLRYKISLLLAAIILAGILPVSVYIVDTQEKERLAAATARGEVQAKLFARSIFNILLMDAGDVKSARIDAREISTIYKGLEKEGLLTAIAYLTSTQPERDKIIIAGFDRQGSQLPEVFAKDSAAWASSPFGRIDCGADDEKCLRFNAAVGPTGKPAALTVELLYSLAEVTAPIYRLRTILYSTIAAVIALLLLAGFYISRRVTQPVHDLMQGVESLEQNATVSEISVSSGDELGQLARAFNRMAKTIDQSMTELKVKNAELKELDRLKDDFLAVTSHELKTPLNGIIGLSGTLLDGATGELSEPLRNNIQVIRSSGVRLAALVDKILQVAELRNTKVSITPMPVDLRQLLEEIKTLMQPGAEAKQLAFRIEAPDDLPMVMADRDRLAQILYNLAGNAVKFTEKGEVVLAVSHQNGVVRIAVKDTGIGIAAADQARIFNSFEQLESSDTRRYGGIGLGLSVSKQLAELHGTHIHVNSTLGKGSEFWFELNSVAATPAARLPEKPPIPLERLSESIANEMRARATEKPKETAGAQVKRGYNILLVDDEPVNLQVLVNQLSLVGYKVTVAESGKEAINYMEHEPVPDAILLDVMMPGMSGYDVSRILRNKYTSYEVPILMLTAKNRSEDVIRGFEAGANDYISKPIESEVLLARVKTAISLKESVREKDMLENLQRELSVAQKIQQALLPVKYPQMPGLRIAARYYPMAEIGGDFYDFVEHEEGLGVLIADVSGHGIPAALIASMVKMAFSLNRHLAPRPGKMLTALNQVLCDKVDNHFVTASYYFIDFKERKVLHASAGHPPLYFVSRNSGTIQERKTRGSFLGVFPEIQHEEGEDSLESGIRLLQVTDGVVENRSRAGHEFGYSRLRDIILKTTQLDSEEMADSLMKELREHNPEYFDDDVTFVLIDYTAES
jgi:two-component system sensor histidine kinase ChiS